VPSARIRLDVAMVDRGLTSTRERARSLILAGQVKVDGAVISKAGTAVRSDSQIDLVVPDHPYVGRGGIKLAHALDTFKIAVTGRHALDIGASTGGFTDALLQRGAESVVAVDVGHGQLDWRLRNDPRVTVREGINARTMVASDLPHAVDLVVIDVAFISLRHIFPAVRALLMPPADVIALVKPQFEAGRNEVGKGGIVSDPAVHQAVLARVQAEAAQAGFTAVAVVDSPITGAAGNREFLLLLRVE
jgi:23S rRNA (cytidine1920-2'-O)/16S rRNA (cytidine1409-2'-O)-methyltransferase